MVVGQERSWQHRQAGREARIAAEVARLRGNAVGLAHSLGELPPRSFTCDACPCAPRCPDSFDLVNVDGFCLAIGRGPAK